MISYSICFSVWLISLTIIPPSPSMLLQMVTFYSLFGRVLSHRVCIDMYTPPPTSSLPTWVTSCLGRCDWCCCEHWGAYIFSCSWAGFFGYTPRRKSLNHVVVVVVWETAILFSTVAAPIYVPVNITNFQKQTWIQIQASYVPMVRWVGEPLKFWDSFSSSPKLRPLQCLTGLRWEGNKVWYQHLEHSSHTAGLLFDKCQRPDFFPCFKPV